MISILKPSARPRLSKKLIREIKSYNCKGVPEALGMMHQAVEDDESTVVIYEDKGAMSYRVKRNYVKIMCLGSRQKGLGRAFMRWLESRFSHKREIRLWASPGAREFYEKLGYVGDSMGYYRKRLTSA